MQIDDRLATVLRSGARGDLAIRTQYRQLIDLLGASQADGDDDLLRAGYDRLASLEQKIGSKQAGEMLSDPALRIRNATLTRWLAGREPEIAAAGMARTRLTPAEWESVIPDLPIPARSMLRHRRDLPEEANRILKRLGVGDLVLPEPEVASRSAAGTSEPEQSPVFEIDPALAIEEAESEAGIGALVKRIEAFQRARSPVAAEGAAPRLPLGDKAEVDNRPLQSFDVVCDSEGRIEWASDDLSPQLAGVQLFGSLWSHPIATTVRGAFARRLPIRGASVSLPGTEQIEGHWRLDATPRFATDGGRFLGYAGRMRRIGEDDPEAAETYESQPSSHLLRQSLHELRTPVNAIQGFAEIIQQQLYGPTPNEYRALAAAIAGDAARMLAGFEELDRLARLDDSQPELSAGQSDLAMIVQGTLEQLKPAMQPRSADISLTIDAHEPTVAMEQAETAQLVWRILATLVSALAPGEVLEARITSGTERAAMRIDLPATLSDRQDIFAGTVSASAQAVNAGMFGSGFTLRLARAEARAAGGGLLREDDALVLILPLLTAETAPNSPSTETADAVQ